MQCSAERNDGIRGSAYSRHNRLAVQRLRRRYWPQKVSGCPAMATALKVSSSRNPGEPQRINRLEAQRRQKTQLALN